MSITIKEIAELAGVSRGTVDRVLNDRGNVAAEIKEKILKIAEVQGYKKNVLASRLASKVHIDIAVIFPNYKEDVFWTAPYEGVKKLEKTFADYGVYIKYYFFNIFDSSSYKASFEKAIKDKVKGILVAPIFLRETLTYLNIAVQNNIPTVCINSEIDNHSGLAYVGQDSFQSGMTCARLLNIGNPERRKIVVISLGHKNNNAIHIQKKIDGLKQFNFDNKRDYEIEDVNLENWKDNQELKKLSARLLEEKHNIRGLFFTNSRAYHFINNTDFVERCEPGTTIVGFDLIEQNISLLENGKIDALLNQNPEQQGYYGIVSLFKHFIYKQQIKSKQYLPIDIVIKENYKTYLEQRVRLLEIAV